MSAPLFRNCQELAVIRRPNVKVPPGGFHFLIGFSWLLRRTGNFLQGAVKPFAQKILAICSNFYKTVKQKRGPSGIRCNNIGRTGIWSGSIQFFRFEHKLRRHKQTFGKIATTVVLGKDENLLRSGLQWHRSCHSNEMTPLLIILAAIFRIRNCSSKIVHGNFLLQ